MQDEVSKHNEKVYLDLGSDDAWQCAGGMSTVDVAAAAMLEAAVNTVLVPGVPKRFQRAKLNEFADRVVGVATAALDDGRGLFLCGKRGRGKTYFAVAVKRELMRRAAIAEYAECWRTRGANSWPVVKTRGEADRYMRVSFSAARRRAADVMFRNAADLMDDIKACFADDARRTKQEVVELYSTVPVLVVDDLGMEKPTEFVRETFDVIVNRRWAEEMLTVFTSNLSFDELEAHYADHGRIASRIAGMCEVIELVGDDRRVG